MGFYSVIILAAILSQGYALQCYNCKNCTTIPEDALKSCPLDPGTTTLAPSSTPAESSSSTTVRTPAPSTPTVTTLSTTSITTPSTPTVTTPSTPTVTTPSTPTVTTPSTSTVTTPSTPTVTTPSTSTVTTPSTPTVTTPSTPTSDGSSGTSPTTTDASDQSNDLPGPGALVYRHLRFVRDTGRDTTYSCYTHEYKVDGQTIIDRGCTSDQELCKDKEGCTLCSTDRCNSATLLKTSMVLLLPALVLRFILFS